MSKELEIKILDVDPKMLEKKLVELGCKHSNPVLQKLYVYDILSISSLYRAILNDWNIVAFKDVVVNRAKQLITELASIINYEDAKIICGNCSENSLSEIGKNFCYSEYYFNFLNSEIIKNIICKYNVNPNKWIRIRQTGDEVTITIKHILKNSDDNVNQYCISDVEEYEMKVESLELAKTILEQMGFYHKNYQEKQRQSFYYEPLNLSIEIDSWPLIPPYLEIEGESESNIYKMCELLGYSNQQIIVANTSKVYEVYGKNIYDYKELKFNQ